MHHEIQNRSVVKTNRWYRLARLRFGGFFVHCHHTFRSAGTSLNLIKRDDINSVVKQSQMRPAVRSQLLIGLIKTTPITSTMATEVVAYLCFTSVWDALVCMTFFTSNGFTAATVTEAVRTPLILAWVSVASPTRRREGGREEVHKTIWNNSSTNVNSVPVSESTSGRGLSSCQVPSSSL